MPIVRIEVCRSRPQAEVTAMIEAVYESQLLALKVPKDDKQIRYIEHKPEYFPVPPGKTANYTIVEFSIFPGRSLEAKRALYAGIVQRFRALGIQPSDVTVILHEPPLDNWGVSGKPASEVNLGFNLNV